MRFIGKDKIISVILFIVSFVAVICIWEVTARHNNPVLFPNISRVCEGLQNTVFAADTYQHLGASLQLISIAFLLSILIAFPTALLCFRHRLFAKTVLPYHNFIRYIPVPAFVPFCTAIFGVGDTVKIVLVFIGTYFQMLFLFINDFESVPKGYIESAETLGFRKVNLITQIIIRAAAPDILNSIRITFAWAWSYLLVAEVVNSIRGVGYLVLQSYRVLNMPRLIAYLFIIGIFGIVMDILFKHIRTLLCPHIKKGEK
ncbi:MAG: ABC transporter permease [Kiritimatiellaeota bacterium]|nr:ABC transporter permease [Kiritimatiellota bacterium]